MLTISRSKGQNNGSRHPNLERILKASKGFCRPQTKSRLQIKQVFYYMKYNQTPKLYVVTCNTFPIIMVSTGGNFLTF